MPVYAVVDSNDIVVNLVRWDGTTPWTPPEGTTVVEVTPADRPNADIGGTYSGGTFTLPAPTPPTPSADEILEAKFESWAKAKGLLLPDGSPRPIPPVP